jgi:hypothetical protein
MMPDTAALPLQYAPIDCTDLRLAEDVYSNTAVLELGERGIAAHVAKDLRRRRLAAVLELANRWTQADRQDR